MEKIDAILISAGCSSLPLIFQKINSKFTDLDPTLLSGFLSAIQSFAEETIIKDVEIEENVLTTSIDYGKRKLMSLKFPDVTISCVNREDKNEQTKLVKILYQIGKEFSERFATEIQNLKEGTIINSSHFESFRPRIFKPFVDSAIKNQWIPFVKASKKEEITSNSHFYSIIDGKKSIEELNDSYPDFTLDNIKELLFIGWYNDFIAFRNVLSDHDILLTKPARARKFVMVDDPLENFMHWDDPNEPAPCTQPGRPMCRDILKEINGKRTVAEILKTLKNHDIKDQIECMWQRDIIEVLNLEKRRILIAKEISATILHLLFKHTKKDVQKISEKAIKHVHSLEIPSEIINSEHGVNVDFSFKNYDELSPVEMAEAENHWMDFNARLIEFTPSKKVKKIIEDLVESLDENFFEKYQSEDFTIGLEDFTYFLEASMI